MGITFSSDSGNLQLFSGATVWVSYEVDLDGLFCGCWKSYQGHELPDWVHRTGQNGQYFVC